MRLRPRLVLLSVAHFAIDAYSSFLSPLLPLLIQRLHLSLSLVGALVAITSVSSSLSQPLFGWLSDRVARPWFVAFGPLVAALFMSAVGAAPSYGGLVGLLLVGGLGAASFHPQAAVLAGELSERRTMALSVFISSGTLGFAFGPLLAVSTVGAFGLSRTWVAGIPGLVLGGVLMAWFARVPYTRGPRPAQPAFGELRVHARPLTLLYFCVVCRSAVSLGFMTFLGIVLHGRGFSIGAVGGLITAYLACGAVGGFMGGMLSERFGKRGVIIRSFAVSAPLYWGFLFLPTVPGLVCLMLGGFVLQSSLPVNVVMGQELSPRHASTISSLLMGAAWGIGAMLVGPVGVIADATSLTWALLALSGTLIAGLGCALGLPRVRA